MRDLRSRFMALAAASVFVLGACGSSVANPVDPVGGVAAAFDIARAGGTLKAMDLVTCAVTVDHALWSWGNSGYGSIPANTIPTRFPGL